MPVLLKRFLNKDLRWDFHDFNICFMGVGKDLKSVPVNPHEFNIYRMCENVFQSRFIFLFLFFLFFPGWLHPLQAQINPGAVQLRVVDPGHLWRPPFGTERVGRSTDVIVSFQSKQIPSDEFQLVGYSGGEEVSRQTLSFINRPPISGRAAKDETVDQASFYVVSKPEEEGVVFSGRPALTEDIDQLALFFMGQSINPVELARRNVKLKSFEADATARPDQVINPVDLGAILVPADWLRLAGGQKAFVTVAALSRDNDIPGAHVTAWYQSAPQNKVSKSFPLNQGNRVRKELSLPACSETLKNDMLHVSVEDAGGKELWHKEIEVMIVPDQPDLPDFGAVFTKLRYDPPVINVVNYKNDPLDYDELWEPEFQDLVVSLPNGSRFVFWRGSSYVPFWAGQYNTIFTYEWAEIISPRDEFVDCPEPLMDKELRYANVEIIESTPARVHVRWSYQSCDFNYKVNGDWAVEDYYFYPDGFGTRVLQLTAVPEAEYEVSEFLILAPQAAFPLDFIPSRPIDVLSVKTGEKEVISLPETDPSWEEVPDPVIYRIRLHKDEPMAAINFNPYLYTKPRVYIPFYDEGLLVTPAYWGGHFPLSRGFKTMTQINESIWSGPSSNSLVTWAAKRPKPLKSVITETTDALGEKKPMKTDTWAWLIGMSGASDESLLQRAKSYAKMPSLELDGAKRDSDMYVPERRSLCLVVEKKTVRIKITPDSWCVNPVFELKNAPKQLKEVKLEGKALPADKYAWDGHTLWVNARMDEPETLELQFSE